MVSVRTRMEKQDSISRGGRHSDFELLRLLSPFLAYIIAMLLFFREPLASGFDLGFGERGDGMIEITILEHWRNVLSGVSHWNATFYFHPYVNTLGYNDGYFLYGVSYAFWRLFFDPFHADTLNILTLKTIGFVAAYRLVSGTFAWGRVTGAAVALLWTVASNIGLQAVHAQLQSVALLPVAMMLAIAASRYEREGRRSAARFAAMALAALVAAWFLTSYYMAWFTLFSAGLFVICWCLLSGEWRPVAVLRLIRRHGETLAWGCAAFLLLIVPFLRVYLPTMRETGGESYDEMLGYLVTPGIDMINVGAENYLWGWIFRPLLLLAHLMLPNDQALPGRVFGGEHESGFPPILCALVVVALWTIVWRGRSMTGERSAIPLRAFATAMTIAWLLTLQFWIASPWGLVFELVPGAKGMRVVSRYQLWLCLPFLLIAVAAWQTRLVRLSGSRPFVTACVALLLVAENLSAETPARLSRAVENGALSAIPAPPLGCVSFYAVATRIAEPQYIDAELNALYPHNVDAMFLAERWQVPTINGFSTFNPPDWAFGDPLAADYDLRVKRYARKHALYGLCRLDVRRPHPWSRI